MPEGLPLSGKSPHMRRNQYNYQGQSYKYRLR
jgi:hypothetical protein